MSTGSPIVAWAAPRRIAACRTAEMITPIATAMIAATTPTTKVRDSTTVVCPKISTRCLFGAATTWIDKAPRNDSGTTTTATISSRFAALFLYTLKAADRTSPSVRGRMPPGPGGVPGGGGGGGGGGGVPPEPSPIANPPFPSPTRSPTRPPISLVPSTSRVASTRSGGASTHVSEREPVDDPQAGALSRDPRRGTQSSRGGRGEAVRSEPGQRDDTGRLPYPGTGAWRMKQRTTFVIAWSVWALSMGALLVPIAYRLTGHRVAGLGDQSGSIAAAVTVLLFIPSFATVGAVLAARRPSNPIGWLLSASGLCYAIATLGILVGSFSTRWSDWLASWAWGVGIAITGTFVLLLFPTGTLPSKRWRPVAWLAGIALCATFLGSAFQPGAIEGTHSINPLGIGGPLGSLFTLMRGLFGLVLPAGLAAFVSLVVRYRRPHLWNASRSSGSC